MSNLQDYLPSKKFGSIVLVLLVVGGGAAIAYNLVNSPDGNTDATVHPEVGNKTGESIAKKDTDGDGVPDWKELVWGTDIKKRDTDGDGVSDKKEIERLEANDSYDKKLSSQDASTGNQEATASTTTDRLAASFYASMRSLAMSGNINEKNVAQVATKATQILEDTNRLTEPYTMTSIDTQPDTPENVYVYSQLMQNFMQANPISPEEIDYIQKAVNNNEQKEDRYQNLKEKYKKVAENLGSAPIPYSATELHLKLMNSFYALHSLLVTMDQNVDDPIVEFAAMIQYQMKLKQIADLYNNFGQYFEVASDKESFEYQQPLWRE